MSDSRPFTRGLTVATASALAFAFAFALAGCVPNNPGSAVIAVDITDTSCEPAVATTTSGDVAFELTNRGTDVNEFEILADDKLRIVGEKENITPGQTTQFVAQLEPGTYFTACKFQQVGAPVGLAEFTVTGEQLALDADEQALSDAAVTNYVSYLRSQAAELLPEVTTFAAAYRAGDDSAARELFPTTRVFYERIEPTAEAFGDLDPKIDYREVDALAEGLEWTGFHRAEKDLWPPAPGELNSDGTDALADWAPSTPDERAAYADGLVADVQQLLDLLSDPAFTVSVADISNGAIGLLDEVAAGKITGEEDWWSHTDLWDFQANVQGAEVAFGNVRPLAESKGAESAALVGEIEKQFTALNALLAQYGSIENGFVFYDTVTESQRRELSDQVNALAEPLSQLTHAVLGVDAK